MAANNIGHIPTETIYIFSGSQNVTTTWEDIDTRTVEEVLPAFITDSNNKKSIETGKKWAVGCYSPHIYTYDPVTKTHTTVPNPVPPKEAMTDTVANDPISRVKVVSLEERGKGGRAYKVVLPRGYYVDMREDVMLDTMKTEGISPGGYLNGRFIWARIGGQMKLVREGSSLHDKLIESTKVVEAPNLSKKDKVVGGIYEDKQNHANVFLGFVKTSTIVFLDAATGEKTTRRKLEQISKTYPYVRAHDNYTIRVVEHKKSELWCHVSKPVLVPGETEIDCSKVPAEVVNHINNNSYGYYYLTSHFTVKDSGSVFTKLGDCVLPADIIQQVRNQAIVKLYHDMADAKKRAVDEAQPRYYHTYNSAPKPVIDYVNSPIKAKTIALDFIKENVCALANMVPFDSATINVPDPEFMELFGRAASNTVITASS